MTIVRGWDGTTYDRISGPMATMGEAVLARLELAGDEVVIDAGCGSGRVTEHLLERLPLGRVVCVDGDPSMIDSARARLQDERASFRVADLCDLPTDLGPADAVFSTATFHWIADHELLFAKLHAALRPGGRLVAQCGGEGNIAELHDAAEAVAARESFAPSCEGWTRPWRFAAPAETEALLLAAGFTSASCWLEPWPVTPQDPAAWIREINLGAHLARLPAASQDAYVDAVLGCLPTPLTIGYVRLNIDAVA